MAINRDISVKVRASLLISELLDVDDPAGRQGGRQGKQGQQVLSYPELIVDKDEWTRRLADAADVLQFGYELTGTIPPQAVTEGATVIAAATATLNGHVLPNTNTSCGFLYGTTRELDLTVNANESIIAAASDALVPITAQLAGLAHNTRYYYRAWAQIALVHVRYGRIRSFVTLP